MYAKREALGMAIKRRTLECSSGCAGSGSTKTEEAACLYSPQNSGQRIDQLLYPRGILALLALFSSGALSVGFIVKDLLSTRLRDFFHAMGLPSNGPTLAFKLEFRKKTTISR